MNDVCRVKTDAFVQGLRREYSNRHRHGRHEASKACNFANIIEYDQASPDARMYISQGQQLQAQDWQTLHSAARSHSGHQLQQQIMHNGCQHMPTLQQDSILHHAEEHAAELRTASMQQQQHMQRVNMSSCAQQPCSSQGVLNNVTTYAASEQQAQDHVRQQV